ncbi:TPA: hypothetical protein ACH3X2_005833 [Trebouxia sp. C0005]|nr:MAG: 3-beta hydroxysteroid dehydrogenase isomerase family [Trebouxia sp. A1-2]
MAPPQSTGPYTAVVTGASGFVASEVVKELLIKGWNVRGTVRSLSKHEKVAHLEALGKALPGKLTLHEADLLKKGSFDQVVKGADYVFHMASPFLAEWNDTQKELVEPALEGTTTVLESVAKSKDTIRRVVLTSSFAAALKMKSGPSNGKLYTEEDWNTDSEADKEGGYMYSKTVAEKKAWEVSKKEGFELATIMPSLVLGPVTGTRPDGTSINVMKGIVEGESAELPFPFVVDVRNIAQAHIQAAVTPKAKGQRYLISNADTVPNGAVMAVLKDRFPGLKFKDAEQEERKPVLDNSKVREQLGISIIPYQDTIIDMATTLIQNGIAKPQKK